jgi:hypothetical protein
VTADVTPWTGGTVTFRFLTTGNDARGWTMWGSPAGNQSTTTNNNFALDKPVSVSSADGESGEWDLSFGKICEDSWYDFERCED